MFHKSGYFLKELLLSYFTNGENGVEIIPTNCHVTTPANAVGWGDAHRIEFSRWDPEPQACETFSSFRLLDSYVLYVVGFGTGLFLRSKNLGHHFVLTQWRIILSIPNIMGFARTFLVTQCLILSRSKVMSVSLSCWNPEPLAFWNTWDFFLEWSKTL